MAPNAEGSPERKTRAPFKITQEGVVMAIAAILFVVFSVVLDKFMTQGNILTLLKNVAIHGTVSAA